MPECANECFLFIAISIEVKASAATEFHYGPASQPVKPASAANSMPVYHASIKSPATNSTQSISVSV